MSDAPAFGPWHADGGFRVRVVADSAAGTGARLTTLEVRTWRAILAELNTHRRATRSSASSRAVPLAKTLDDLRRDPFVPTTWGANRPGMSAGGELDPAARVAAEATWRAALADAVRHAEALDRLGLHKQLANRLLEPFLWHTVLWTMSGDAFGHFFALRAHPDAQPEMQVTARLMHSALAASTPVPVPDGEWHLPLLSDGERASARTEPLRWRKVSTGRCARVSYRTHAGVRDVEKDVELHDALLANWHMSPFEHVARPLTAAEGGAEAFSGNFRGWKQYRKEIPHEDDYSATLTDDELAALVDR